MTDLGRTEVRRADCTLCDLAQTLEEDFIVGCRRVRRLTEAGKTHKADQLDAQLDQLHDMAHALGTTHNGDVL